MSFIELFLLAVGLSMDAFAVSVCKGLGMPKINRQVALALAALFGGFQALMPFIGWALGSQFMWLIEPIDHWVAFILLAFIGGKMLVEGIRDDEDSDPGTVDHVAWPEFIMLAVATSIDALAAGISLAALSVNIWLSISFIGAITFCLTLVGVKVGNLFGTRYQRPATIAGGAVLVIIGLRVLLQHLGVIAF